MWIRGGKTLLHKMWLICLFFTFPEMINGRLGSVGGLLLHLLLTHWSPQVLNLHTLSYEFFLLVNHMASEDIAPNKLSFRSLVINVGFNTNFM